MTTDGIDVSAHQLVTPSLAGLDFLIARATYGSSPDGRYRMHTAAARAAGLVVGAYHFGVNAPAGSQVDAFLASAGDADLFILDLEAEAGIPRMTDAQASAFIAGVKARGKRCGLYHSESGFPSLGQSYNWVANWSNPPSIAWAFWQYRGGPIDLDRYNGTVAQLRSFAGVTLPPGGTAVGLFLDFRDEPPQPGKIKGTGHYVFRVADANRWAIEDGHDMGLVRHANLIGTLPTWAQGDPHVVIFDFNNYGLTVAVIRDVALGPVPTTTDTTPFSQADKDAAQAAGYADAKAKAIGAVQAI